MGLVPDFTMSAFTPTQVTLEPPARPDNLSAAVLHSLSRPITGKTSPNVVLSFIFGALTFGIVPLLSWPRKFGRFVVAEQQQFWHLVEWLRIRTGDEEAAKLRESVRDTGAVSSTWLVPMVILVILAVYFLPLFDSAGFDLDRLLGVTYLAAPWVPPHFIHHYYSPTALYPWIHLHKVWNLCLVIAFASHWLHGAAACFGRKPADSPAESDSHQAVAPAGGAVRCRHRFAAAVAGGGIDRAGQRGGLGDPGV